MTAVFSLRRTAALLGLSLAAACAAAPAARAASAPALQAVAFDQAGRHLGREVVVRTTQGSRRAGTLVRHSRTALRLRLAPRDGGVELDIPSSSVRDVLVAREPDTSAGDDSAQKN